MATDSKIFVVHEQLFVTQTWFNFNVSFDGGVTARGYREHVIDIGPDPNSIKGERDDD